MPAFTDVLPESQAEWVPATQDQDDDDEYREVVRAGRKRSAASPVLGPRVTRYRMSTSAASGGEMDVEE